MNNRRTFLRQTGVLSAFSPFARQTGTTNALKHLPDNAVSKWPDGSRLVVSISMQFESGGQPDNAESPFPRNMQPGFRDLPAVTWYEYGVNEGIPRMLDNWDELGIKVTSHMVGAAVAKHPDLAKEIVRRGHEAAAHGMNWRSQYDMSYNEEKAFIADGAEAVRKATGVDPIGYNANWLRRGENTLKILGELGFQYHIDDLSRDEPFVIGVAGRDLAVVPYTIRCNDILLIEGRNFSVDQFVNQVKAEFDLLYKEGATRRRQMSISFHDRIGGTPQMVLATHELVRYMQRHPGVSFKRKDEIARIILSDPTAIRR
ncbi:MAG: polysaccharide deacetylase family protein [Dyadobacter sp.]|uniref:polysaccharide deacetylase family protein n=1 Tax=Dyadobacter sp. TaxID=1914288 RepID=UPI001B0CCE04|nr:polysaccharide deacetylase family protein [Dyadobacter sp.]MBO9616949.1 polysaccharide deacetylase family protein [Dyadobacter sp.]